MASQEHGNGSTARYNKMNDECTVQYSTPPPLSFQSGHADLELENLDPERKIIN